MVARYEERYSWICVCLFSLAKFKGETSRAVEVNATLEHLGVEVGQYFMDFVEGLSKTEKWST